mmetsp:Transcript_25955/g.25212  ORF Transcript_25955/g.25212 Transcript_25955/m.25212 type:complete len:93 (-) Transcript_25955:267-545(-)
MLFIIHLLIFFVIFRLFVLLFYLWHLTKQLFYLIFLLFVDSLPPFSFNVGDQFMVFRWYYMLHLFQSQLLYQLADNLPNIYNVLVSGQLIAL